MPKQTTKAPWKQNQSYAHDLMDLRFGVLEDGVLEFKKKPARTTAQTPLREAALA